MFKPKLPWVLRGSDFAQLGWHTKPTAAYQLMFEFLRISPTYELARMARNNSLSAIERQSLPSDFDQVLKTYDLLGDVNCILFRTWWLERGLKAFGNPFTKPKVRPFSILKADTELSLPKVNAGLNTNLRDQRRDEGLSASLLVAIPLTLKTSEVQKQIKKLLDLHREKGGVSTQQPAIKLCGKRLNANAIFKGLRLLWFKAAKPNWELWRLGAKADFSSTYSKVLNPEAPRNVGDSVEESDRVIMSKITFRALEKFQLIAENAARGKFPSNESVEMSEFDYQKISRRLLAHSKWVKMEKARLQESPADL